MQRLNKIGVRYVCFFLLFIASACTNTETLDPTTAQIEMQQTWRQGWHGTWELTWPQAPLSGPLVFEAWFSEGGQHRFEILEAPLPTFVGLVYINNGATATYYNRFEDTLPITDTAESLPFSPLSHAFDIITEQLARHPHYVQIEKPNLGDNPIVKYVFSYPESQNLTIWLNTQENLIIRVHLHAQGTDLILAARSIEILDVPHPKLFGE